MIPDFSKLGYNIMAATLIRHSEPLSKEKIAEIVKMRVDIEKQNPNAYLMTVDGMGFGKDRLFITLFEDFSAYSHIMQLAREIPHVDLESVDSFIVDLNDKNQYRILSMAAISNHILRQAEKIGKPSRGKKPVAKSKNAKRDL